MILLSAAWAQGDVGKLIDTVAYLKRYARQVIVIGPIPVYKEALPTLLARSILHHSDNLLSASRADYVFQLDQTFKGVLPAAEYVSLVDGFCLGRKCVVYAKPGVPLQFDDSHLTSEGSMLVARYLQQELAPREPAGAVPGSGFDFVHDSNVIK